MKLYVCFGTFGGGSGHPCGAAHDALKEAGYVLNVTRGRKEAKELTGSTAVPVLVTDGGEAISEGKAIVAWAEAHPAA